MAIYLLRLTTKHWQQMHIDSKINKSVSFFEGVFHAQALMLNTNGIPLAFMAYI